MLFSSSSWAFESLRSWAIFFFKKRQLKRFLSKQDISSRKEIQLKGHFMLICKIWIIISLPFQFQKILSLFRYYSIVAMYRSPWRNNKITRKKFEMTTFGYASGTTCIWKRTKSNAYLFFALNIFETLKWGCT